MMRVTAGCLFLIIAFVNPADSAAAPSKSEKNLERETARIEKTVSTAAGEKAVVRRLTADFGISEDQVAALRQRGLSYGELAAVLSLARSLPGGASDTNIQKVVGLRQGPPVLGWGQVANGLGIKLGAVVSQIKKVNNESHREMKQEPGKGRKEKQHQQAAPPREERPRTFDGEGRSMNRGSAAQ